MAMNFWVQMNLALRDITAPSDTPTGPLCLWSLLAHRAPPGDAPCCCCQRHSCTRRRMSPCPPALPSQCRASSLPRTPALGSQVGQRGVHLWGRRQQPFRLPSAPGPTQKLDTARHKALLVLRRPTSVWWVNTCVGRDEAEERDPTVLPPAQGGDGDPVALAGQPDGLPLQHGHGSRFC